MLRDCFLRIGAGESAEGKPPKPRVTGMVAFSSVYITSENRSFANVLSVKRSPGGEFFHPLCRLPPSGINLDTGALLSCNTSSGFQNCTLSDIGGTLHMLLGRQMGEVPHKSAVCQEPLTQNSISQWYAGRHILHVLPTPNSAVVWYLVSYGKRRTLKLLRDFLKSLQTEFSRHQLKTV